MIVFELIEHDVWQGIGSFVRLGLFSTAENAVAFLRSHVERNGWDSTEGGFSVYRHEVDEPDYESKVFCTLESERDYETIIWWDSHAKERLPAFYSVSGEDCDDGKFEDVVVCVGAFDSFSNLIDGNKLFHVFWDEVDLANCYKPGEYTFVFAGEHRQLSVDEVFERGILS